jgi:hypothetical protein
VDRIVFESSIDYSIRIVAKRLRSWYSLDRSAFRRRFDPLRLRSVDTFAAKDAAKMGHPIFIPDCPAFTATTGSGTA